MAQEIKLNEEIETITLNTDTLEPLSPKPSVNFGSGIELLMNDKVKSGEKKQNESDINLSDLNSLEDELNNLSQKHVDIKPVTSVPKSELFKEIVNNNVQLKNVKLDNPVIENLGKATAQTPNANENKNKEENKWQFNNVPIDPDKPVEKVMSPEEVLADKFSILRKLETLEKKGVKLTKKYSMDSNYHEMKGEYELILADKEKANSIKFQGKMLMAAITGIEFLNNRFDPFDVKLDGWSEQLNENIDDYDEIFGELHEKYKSKATMAPELKLLFQLGGSAIMVHMTNTMFKSSMPGMEDIMKQNPELMQQFTAAAVNTMSNDNPGFGGFMNNMVGNNQDQNYMYNQAREDITPNPMSGPPPAPVKTRTQKSTRSNVPQNRPDMQAAREEGVSMNNSYAEVGLGVDKPIRSAKRPDMKGPSDISDILSGLKKKPVEQKQPGIQSIDDSSTISIQDLKDMEQTKIPSRSKRRSKTSGTSISLDI